MTAPKIGFIGLGLMGGNMAECLQNNGFDLVVMGRKQSAVEPALARGAVEASTPKELAEASDIVMLCVTTIGRCRKLDLRRRWGPCRYQTGCHSH